ncbi:hypothetical protein G6F68_017999 [Rhizopus microsporus]|nr:hypothetical protein G6F68_017999 [Rhizopus microsporus]
MAPPGGNVDTTARLVAQKLAERLNQSIIVDNVAGAGGVLGVARATHAAPDGYTLVAVGVSTAASGVSLFKDLPYNPAKALAPIGAVA